jgi:hypothetical protein
MLDSVKTSLKRLKNFLSFARGFFHRKNPFKMFLEEIVTSLKEMFSIRQKLKMAQYRVNYHKHQLSKMESLIAESNEHTFLKGKNLNETR